MRIFIQPPHVWGSPEEIVRIAYKVLQNFEVSSARPGAIVGNQAVVLVATPHVARAIAVLERAGMRAVRDLVFRSRGLPRLEAVGAERRVRRTALMRGRAPAEGRVAQEQMNLPLVVQAGCALAVE